LFYIILLMEETAICASIADDEEALAAAAICASVTDDEEVLAAAVICASIADDEEALAAAVLHDVVEDAGALAAAALHDVVEDAEVTADEIESLFGRRVAEIVAGDSEDKREGLPPAETWKIRKVENIEHIKAASDPGVRIVCLGDKLSNIRSIQRDLEALGDKLWQRFNQKDPAEHAWYYSTIAEALRAELGDTDAWREYRERVDAVFEGCLE